MMNNWIGTIVGPPSTTHENRIYSIHIQCGANYPDQPPIVRFISKINMTCVNQSNGVVEPSRFFVLGTWKNSNTMENILVGLRKEMASSANKKLSQSGENETF